MITEESVFYVAEQMKKLGVQEERILSVIYHLLHENVEETEHSRLLKCSMKSVPENGGNGE